MLHQNAYIRRCEVLLSITLILYSIYESESNAFELVQRQYVSDNLSFFSVSELQQKGFSEMSVVCGFSCCL